MKRVMSINEVSEYVDLSKNYIRDLIVKGEFPYFNISKGRKAHFKFDVVEVDKWVANQPGNKMDDIE